MKERWGKCVVGLAVLVMMGGLATPVLANESAKVDKATKLRVQEAYGKLPLHFIQNNGQVDKKVKFYEKGAEHSTFFTQEGVYLLLTKSQKEEDNIKRLRSFGLSQAERKKGIVTPEDTNYKSQLIKLAPLGANKNPEIIAEDLQKGKVNYFIGNDKSKWRTNVPTYLAVRYKDVYENIDIKFYGNNRQLEYDVVVKPGADPALVKFGYEGIDGLKLTDEGELLVAVGGSNLIHRKPYIYQEIDGKRVEVEGAFKVINNAGTGLDVSVSPVFDVSASPEAETDKGSDSLKPFGLRQAEISQGLKTGSQTHAERPQRFTYGFKVAAYNKNYALIIDPILAYSTYLGGSGWEEGRDIAVDAAGNAYVTGNTASSDFPTTAGAYREANGGGWEAFVTKIDASGSFLSYSTYLGGGSNDYGTGIVVDTFGNAFIIGHTYSNDFPATTGAYQGANAGGADAFVAKIDAAGASLSYSTYLGGSDWDGGYGIAVDTAGNIYISGHTRSSNFPTVSPIQGANAGGLDVFVTKIDAAGSSLAYSTYLGGSGNDYSFGIAIDTAGNAYITGDITSSDFPTVSPIQGSNGGGTYDGFVTKIDAAGSSFAYSTYLGGSGYDGGLGIAVDSAGNAYVTGWTKSSNFPTTGGVYQESFAGGDDVFIAKIDASGSFFSYSTFLGGTGYDSCFDIAIDTAGNAYVTGGTRSTNFPTVSPIQGTFAGGAVDAFVAKIDAAGANLFYSTYLGGSGFDSGAAIAIDTAGSAYITGEIRSTDFPTQNPFQAGHAGGTDDAFVTKICTDADNDGVCDAYDISLQLKKAEVEWEEGKIKLKGKLALPIGESHLTVNSIGAVVIDLPDPVGQVVNQSVNFIVKDGKKWEYKTDSDAIGIRKFKIDWKGAKFEYKGDIHIEADLGDTTTSLEIEPKDVTGEFTILVGGVEITVYENGDVTAVPSEGVTIDLDDDGEIEVGGLPFVLTPHMTIDISGVVSDTVPVSDYYTAAVGKFKIEAGFYSGGNDGSLTPATLLLEVTLGTEGFPGTFDIDDWKDISSEEWKYKQE